MKRFATTALVIATLAMGGCVFAPGDSNGSNWKHEPSKPTVGQQLMDLDRAREKGVINDAEFERAKRDILDSAKR